MRRLTPFFTPVQGGHSRVYISGPMTGIVGANVGSFNRAAYKLRSKGYAVCSPAETSEFLGEFTHEQFLRFDFERIFEADFIAVLPGWENSVGALAELLMATRMGMECWSWSTWVSCHDVILISADDVVRAIAMKHYADSIERTFFAPIAGGKL